MINFKLIAALGMSHTWSYAVSLLHTQNIMKPAAAVSVARGFLKRNMLRWSALLIVFEKEKKNQCRIKMLWIQVRSQPIYHLCHQ